MATNFTKGAALWGCGLSMDFFSEGKGDFLKRFGWFINEDTELDFEANRVMLDSLLEFANNYKDKADINIIYKLFVKCWKQDCIVLPVHWTIVYRACQYYYWRAFYILAYVQG